MTFDRIKGWYEAFDGNVYFSYSGGKDSTVLLEMVAVFCKEYGYTLYVAFCDTVKKVQGNICGATACMYIHTTRQSCRE